MGVNVINFGTDTAKPTTASFAVGTDVKQAAMDATEALIEMMAEKERSSTFWKSWKTPTLLFVKKALKK